MVAAILEDHSAQLGVKKPARKRGNKMVFVIGVVAGYVLARYVNVEVTVKK